jgi:hypothetical protein
MLSSDSQKVTMQVLGTFVARRRRIDDRCPQAISGYLYRGSPDLPRPRQKGRKTVLGGIGLRLASRLKDAKSIKNPRKTN